jgi:hypothetical protein
MSTKFFFQIQCNKLPTWTPANPLGARNLSHSSAMSLNFHSNKCTIALLPSTAWGFFWPWMFATENKRHTRCSSTILQDVVPTHWKGCTIYTPLINGMCNSVKSIMPLMFQPQPHTIYHNDIHLITTHAIYMSCALPFLHLFTQLCCKTC